MAVAKLPDPEDLTAVELRVILHRVLELLYSYVDYYLVMHIDPEKEIDPLNGPDDMARILHDFDLVKMTGRTPLRKGYALQGTPWRREIERLNQPSLADIVRRVRRILLAGAREGDEPEEMRDQWDRLMTEWRLKPFDKKQDWRPRRRRP
jgi:hypothetical protein